MFRLLILHCSATLVALAMCGTLARAQTTLPRAGQDFSFGIPEGPDKLIGPDAEQETQLILTVSSIYSGCGVIRSPSGYTQDFSFEPGTGTVISLPYNLMLLNDLGLSNKGLLVHTTAPANLVLHDYAPQAGDATQILPDPALDTSYVAFGWGIWDDPSDQVPERNTTQLLVTASEDSTLVTITPSVTTLLGQTANVPITVMLNRGECYIEKADTSDHPADPSLSGSLVESNKPVSVISGLTCAYVPNGAESCNELLDELIGKRWWGSHFLTQPLGNSDNGIYVVLTSDRDFYAQINKGFSNSVNKRLVTEFGGPAEIHTFDFNGNPIRVEAQQLTRGSDYGFLGDPTLVTILDTTYYADTLVWNTPSLPFQSNAVPIIYPTADAGTVLLDQVPLNQSSSVSSVVNGSTYSAIIPYIQPGYHTLISPDPIFALVTGFDQADAYSFVAGTAGSELPRDTVSHAVLLTADSATTCGDFTVSASLATPIANGEHLLVLTIPITYDPSVLRFASILPGALLDDGNFTVDSSTPGDLIVTVSGTPYLTGSDLFRIVFQGWKSVSTTTIGNNSYPSFCGDDSENVLVHPVTLAVNPSGDSAALRVTISSSPASRCQPLTIFVGTDSIVSPGDNFVLTKIAVGFDTAQEMFINSASGSLLQGIPYRQSGAVVGNYSLTVNDPTVLSGSDSLLIFTLDPQIETAASTVTVRISFIRCGDTVTETFPFTFPIVEAYDTTHATLSISTSSVSLGNQAEVDVSLSGLPTQSNVFDFALYLTYDHDVITYDHSDVGGTLINTWPSPSLHSGISADTLLFTSRSPLSSTPGTLLHLLFETFVADSNFTPITITSSLTGTSNNCPIVYSTPETTALFLGEDLCGDSVLRNTLLGRALVIEGASISMDGDLDLSMQIPVSGTVTLTLYDELGRPIWMETFSGSSGTDVRSISLPQNLPTGPVTLEVTDGGQRQLKELLLLKH